MHAVSLASASGVRVTLITYGASIQSVAVADRNGHVGEVTYGHDSLAAYLAHPQYAGSTVGRVANRIAAARFSLDGRTYRLDANDADNALHGGSQGFDKANWRIADRGKDHVTFTHVSADGDGGFRAI